LHWSLLRMLMYFMYTPLLRYPVLRALLQKRATEDIYVLETSLAITETSAISTFCSNNKTAEAALIQARGSFT
jgi:hypothetical protein